MANANGKKLGLTCLFPILEGEHAAQLRKTLRALDRDPFGSPLSKVGIIHMARFVIIEDLAYQGLPAKRDTLMSRYLLFLCDFDGTSADAVVAGMTAQIGDVVDEIWSHCVAYPGRASRDRLTAYFEQCQLETNLLLVDRPNDELQTILRALMCKREFARFVENYQASPGDPKASFQAMWAALQSQPTPMPGSL
jgi:hypothetical protein